MRNWAKEKVEFQSVCVCSGMKSFGDSKTLPRKTQRHTEMEYSAFLCVFMSFINHINSVYQCVKVFLLFIQYLFCSE